MMADSESDLRAKGYVFKIFPLLTVKSLNFGMLYLIQVNVRAFVQQVKITWVSETGTAMRFIHECSDQGEFLLG